MRAAGSVPGARRRAGPRRGRSTVTRLRRARRGARRPTPRCAPPRSARGARRAPTEPRPLELDARPDACRDLGRKRRRRLLDAWEGERAAAAEADLHRTDAPPAARVLGARDRDRHDRRAGLQREPPDTATRLADGALADAR